MGEKTNVTLPKCVEPGIEKAKPNTAPISSLIPDILREIFEHGCSTPASFLPETTEAPALAYSQVCRSWRSLTLARSTLWSSMSWGLRWWRGHNTMYRNNSDKRLAVLWDLYLSRSRQALLHVSLYLHEYDAPELREHLLDSVFKEQHRLHHLEVDCNEDILPEGTPYLLSAAPRLGFLKIKVFDRYRGIMPPKKVITVDLSGFTSLRELDLSDNVLLRGRVPANVLESLRTLNYWTVHTLPQNLATPASNPFSFLHYAPRIRRTEISGEFMSPGVLSAPPPRLDLCHLRELRLGLNDRDADFAESLLADSEIPALEEMVLAFFADTRGYQRRRWTQGKILKTLKVLLLNWVQNHDGTQDTFFDEDLRRLLQCTPALKSLHIASVWITPQTLLLLTHRSPEDAASNVCPALEKLVLDGHDERNFLSQVVIDLISSRWRPPQEKTDNEGATSFSGLTDVHLSFFLDESGEGQRRLADLRTVEPVCSFIQQGLKLVFEQS
ncbi:hypothetical protein SCHPADRAFT_1002586 [Schizopora paradoxa]|uniref:F-box domain-containing protein n=1 Tax=Schizopora paradoxa TaxID=27342 RepID=A0A0H2RMD9_9AGAM|nr:hypothetical protein SCHPADRAFT_1002586 [Schizopora paradoxa]